MVVDELWPPWCRQQIPQNRSGGWPARWLNLLPAPANRSAGDWIRVGHGGNAHKKGFVEDLLHVLDELEWPQRLLPFTPILPAEEPQPANVKNSRWERD